MKATMILMVAVTAGSCLAQVKWEIGTPIVTYYAGPSMTDATAQQMAEGNFNVVWCTESQLDNVQRHGLRGMLRDGLLSPAVLDDDAKRAELDALIERVKGHPALYSYYLIDEPNASRFPEFGRLVAYLREKDPARMAYINLFPTYATNEQLGNTGDVVTAYTEHLRQFVDIVRPDLISYDHYHFTAKGDNGQYFLNLALIREAALKAGVPFLNIVQACSWTPSMRVPSTNEVRWLAGHLLLCLLAPQSRGRAGDTRRRADAALPRPEERQPRLRDHRGRAAAVDITGSISHRRGADGRGGPAG